ncbi:hypothetical protein Aduo_010267 [Ancylostoma duodenale]
MMSKPMLGFFLLLAIALVCVVLLDHRPAPLKVMKWQEHLEKKKSRKWIVVTTVQHPTEDIKRLSRIPGWTLVVVGDTKTPENWSLEGVHYLSVEDQQRLGYRILDYLPYKSYARKNIGYLYAIENGAEWIYDTDDDNKPYGSINSETALTQEINKTENSERFSPEKLFNPYSFFGKADMWPRGFPIEYIQNHKNGPGRCCLCHKMRTAAVQQGLVHKDPDVDALYRLLHADKREGLDEGFNKFAPPITLASGTYAPWNSQNTLFHRRAFFTLMLPVTVSFRVTDIWRSYFAQKLLHMIGENIAFYPANAIQIRNAHNYLDDFRSEENIYLKTGKLVKFLDGWRCTHTSIANCAIELADEFRARKFWRKTDAILMRKWIEDLRDMSYEFPPIKHIDESSMSPNESLRGSNCRRAEMEFVSERSWPNEVDKRSRFKIRAFGDLSDWCEAANYSEFLHKLPSPRRLSVAHEKDGVLADLKNTALIITYNYPMNQTIGVLQRMYQPYFGVTIFCGPWYPEEYDDNSDFPKILRPFSYIHLSKNEIQNGYYAYYCLAKVKDLRLGNLQGYFMTSDDNTFNFWHEINLNTTMHPSGTKDENINGTWWPTDIGGGAVKRAVYLFEEKYKNDTDVQAVWDQYQDGISKKMIEANASSHLRAQDGWAISDMYYVPSSLLDYHAGLMEIFFEARLFHEIAVSKYLYTVPHQLLRESEYRYLWYPDDRSKWDDIYNEYLVVLHPIKISHSEDVTFRKRFCRSVLKTFWSNLLDIGRKDAQGSISDTGNRNSLKL